MVFRQTTRAMLLALATTGVAVIGSSSSTVQADPPQPRRVVPPPHYQQELSDRYSPLYRDRYEIAPGRLDRIVRSERLRPSYRFSFPLNQYRYRSVPNRSQYFHRRMTPYYDGRGYGVPSTSPFRYRQDLDGPRRLP